MIRYSIISVFVLMACHCLVNGQSRDYPVVKGLAGDLFSIGELTYEDKLDNQDTFLSDWVVQMNDQGNFERYAKIIDGKLEVLDPAGCTIWLKRKLSGPVCICYRVIVSSERDTSNIIVPRDINNFWLAGEAGKLGNILDSKRYRGKFPDYHEMQGYYGFRMTHTFHKYYDFKVYKLDKLQ